MLQMRCLDTLPNFLPQRVSTLGGKGGGGERGKAQVEPEGHGGREGWAGR